MSPSFYVLLLLLLLLFFFFFLFSFFFFFFFFFFLLIFLIFLFPFHICHFLFLFFLFFFFADFDECTSSTPVCGIHSNCTNTLGSFRCECKAIGESCQGKISTKFISGKVKPFIHIGYPLTLSPRQSKTQGIQVFIIMNVSRV